MRAVRTAVKTAVERSKGVVLLSGGLDSTVNLFAADRELDVVLALTFNYGQRAFTGENTASAEFCRQLGLKHRLIDLTWFRDFTETSLINLSQEIPVGDRVDIDGEEASIETAKAVWVPNRNGIFLNIAAGFAEGLGAEYVIPGFNLEEAQTFPDNSQDYLQALDVSFSFSTANQVKTKCFTTEMTKPEIARLGKTLNVDFSQMWPCYHNGHKWCGKCESCQRDRRALQEIGVKGDFQ